MNHEPIIWTSQAMHITPATCVDIKVASGTVILGQLGDTWLHDLHLTPEEADSIAYALLEGAQQARA